MTALAPSWAFSAQAIATTNDPHLPKGVHLRLIPSQQLGLPAAPFLVYRLPLGFLQQQQAPWLQRQIRWTDSFGNVLTPPINVRPDNPITGWFVAAPNAVCCWAQVVTESDALQVEALVNHGLKLQPIARSDRQPHIVSASRIDRIVVSGKGTIFAGLWLNARALLLEKMEPWRRLALPVSDGERYVGLPDAAAQATDRVFRGAPQRLGLHDDPSVFDPSVAATIPPDAELDRLDEIRSPLDRWLDRLLNDLSNSPPALFDSETVLDAAQGDRAIGKIDINCLGMLLQASIDPGVARWLGFMELDENPPVVSFQESVAYIIRGVWLADPQALVKVSGDRAFDILWFDLQPGMDDFTWRTDFPDLDVNRLDRLGLSYFDFYTIAVATPDAESPRPNPPLLFPAEPKGWMPLPAPQAERQIILPAAGLLPGAAIALARSQAGTVTPLNRFTERGRAIALTPAVTQRPHVQAEFSDRTAPPDLVTYRIAQADWFGRWSNWTEQIVAAGERPRPSPPILTVTYQQPAVDEPIPTEPLSGTLRIEAAVPPATALAPAAFFLKQLELRIHAGEAPADRPLLTTTAPRSATVDLHTLPDRKLVIELSDPQIAVDRALDRLITVTARWRDTADQLSDDTDPVTLRLTDPRPPLPLPPIDDLKYSSRPDITGKARVELPLQTTPTHRRFRVYYSDEVRVMSFLEQQAATNPTIAPLVAQIQAASSDLIRRAQIFTTLANRLPRRIFEQLTRDPLEPADGAIGSTIQFQHAVSGALRVLSFYRIVAVSGSNVEAIFTESPLLKVAVPNTLPPTRPFLTVASLPGTPKDRMKLVIEVPPGSTPAAEYRLRRSSIDASDPLKMPIVETGTVPPLVEGNRSQTVELLQTTETLQSWRTYYWRVEVRGGSEPGASGPPAVWSAASDAVSFQFIPDPPAALQTPLQIRRLAPAAAAIEWQYPVTLNGGSAGLYRFELYRQLPGDRSRLIATLSASNAVDRQPDGVVAYQFVDEPEAIAALPAGTAYRVIVIDPIDRRSPAPSNRSEAIAILSDEET